MTLPRNAPVPLCGSVSADHGHGVPEFFPGETPASRACRTGETVFMQEMNMQRPVTIDERFSVGRDQPRPGEIAAIAEGGYRSLVNLRPAGEEGQTMRPEEEAAEARAAGLRYVHLPVRLDQVT